MPGGNLFFEGVYFACATAACNLDAEFYLLIPEAGLSLIPDEGLIDRPLLTKSMMTSWFLLFCAKVIQVSPILLVA